MTIERILSGGLLLLVGATTLAAFAAYRSPHMLFLLDSFRLCG